MSSRDWWISKSPSLSPLKKHIFIHHLEHIERESALALRRERERERERERGYVPAWKVTWNREEEKFF